MFLFKSKKTNLKRLIEFDAESVKEELADVINYCIQMSQVLNVDIVDIVNDKMDKTEAKYPVEKAKGVSTKYNKLKQYKKVVVIIYV